MKIKTLKIGSRISHNYNSYECGYEVELEDSDNVQEIKKKLFEDCRRECSKQILNDMKGEKHE